MNKAYLVIFQAKIGEQWAQVEIPTIKDPFHSRQVRRDCEAVARAAFGKLEGFPFTSTTPIKCVEILIVPESPEAEKANLN